MVRFYGRVTPAGACLILKPVDDLAATIVGAMEESRRIADFKVYPMLDGDFLVFFASSLLVYVGREEFATMRERIVADLDNLKFPSEVITAAAAPLRPDDVLVGLYARGKLQRDAWRETGYIIVSPEVTTPSQS